MTYAETIEYLIGLEATRGWDLKLERVHRALDALGRPQERYPSLLIAGTNGKGSTSALTAAAFSRAGHRTGLYTSPHLVHFTERIRIDGEEVARADVVSMVERIRRLAPPEKTGLTFFEVATLVALTVFAREEVDLAVLEVGLGGRLDATNVVEPLVSAVVSIDLDHQAYLGTTLDEIAREKAGVMRAGCPVVVAEQIPPEARRALSEMATRIGAKVLEPRKGNFELRLPGSHMQRNAAVAAALVHAAGEALPELRVPDDVAAEAFAGVEWPGRLASMDLGAPTLIDGAHNREAADALLEALPGLFEGKPYRLVFGALEDKPWAEISTKIAVGASSAVAVPVASVRSVASERICEHLAAELPTCEAPGVCQAVDMLARESPTSPILVAGSLFLVGELYAHVLRRRGYSSVFQIEQRTAA